MKWTLPLFLTLALLAVAGCASDQPTVNGYEEFGFRTDLIPPPIEGMSAADIELVTGIPVVPIVHQ